MFYRDRYCSRAALPGGALTLCAQAVSILQWETTDASANQKLWDWTASLSALQLKQSDFCTLPQGKLPLNRLTIQAHSATLDIFPSEGKLTYLLSSGERYSCAVTPPSSICDDPCAHVIRTALYLLDAATPQAVERKLAKMKLMGMIAPLKAKQ